MNHDEPQPDPATTGRPWLSVIIPARNEAGRLPATLDRIQAYLSPKDYLFEVLVVENGSTDDTWNIASTYASRFPTIRVIQEDAPGKGQAVRSGMLKANGEYRFICDADLSMPIEEIDRLLPPLLNDFDIAIGSRYLPSSQLHGYPPLRKLVGKVFNNLVRFMLLSGIADTQCGFKCFHRNAAERLFPRQTLNGFAFDVEVLFMARRWGMKVVEVPIEWHFDPDTRVNLCRDSYRMAKDLLGIRRRARKGYYDLDSGE